MEYKAPNLEGLLPTPPLPSEKMEKEHLIKLEPASH
jgi:hypothetical protein